MDNRFISIYIIIIVLLFFVVFFFQAEDGIRDRLVTGVQTCALPISHHATLGKSYVARPPDGPAMMRVRV